jgi:predicted benzoate:H+ symporter BenE
MAAYILSGMEAAIFFYFVCEAIGTAASSGLLCQPRVIVKMIVEKQMECRLAGETEVLLGENLPQRHFCPSQNPT